MSEFSAPRPASKAPDRPKKPYPDFPLTPHASGAWQKKIRGKTCYFGKWARRIGGRLERIPGDAWEEALALYKEQADDLHAGRTPRVSGDGLTVRDLCNHFLTAKTRKVEAGELTTRMFGEYKLTCELVVSAFGANRLVDDLAAADFAGLRATLVRRWGPLRVLNGVVRVKSVFKYGFEAGLLDRPARYGPEFSPPSKSVLRRHRAKAGEKMIEATDLLRLIDSADVQTRAAILLGLNCGFGNSDVATLPLSALDLARGWVVFPRPKTGIPRRCPLWPETVAAVQEAIDARPKPADFADCGRVFLTERGTALVRAAKATSRCDVVAVRFGALLKRTGLHRPGMGFYTLRHVFRTVADGARDAVACDVIMGHADNTMGGHYRERIEDARLIAVAEHVRNWVLAGRPGA